MEWNYKLVTLRGERFYNYYMRPFQVSSTLHLFCNLSNSRWLHPVKEVVQVTCSFLLHFKADVCMAWAILVFHCGEYSSESSLTILLILHSKSLSESQKPWSLCYLKFTQEFSKCIVISKLSLFLFVIQQAFNFWLKIPGDKLSVIAEVVKMLHNSSLL